MDFAPVLPGERLGRLTAPAWNALRDAAIDTRADRQSRNGADGTKNPSRIVALVRNNTGGGLTPYAVLALRGPIVTPTANLDEFKRQANFEGFQAGQTTLVRAGTTTSGSPTVTGIPTGGFMVGLAVSGTGIPGATTVSSVDSPTQLTLSANATASGSPSLTFTLASNTDIADSPQRFAVLLEAAPDGACVRAAIAGVAPCQVNMVTSGDRWAKLSSGHTYLASDSSGGSAAILWSESGTGVKWALIGDIGKGTAGGGSINVSESDGTPAPMAINAMIFDSIYFTVTISGATATISEAVPTYLTFTNTWSGGSTNSGTHDGDGLLVSNPNISTYATEIRVGAMQGHAVTTGGANTDLTMNGIQWLDSGGETQNPSTPALSNTFVAGWGKGTSPSGGDLLSYGWINMNSPFLMLSTRNDTDFSSAQCYMTMSQHNKSIHLVSLGTITLSASGGGTPINIDFGSA